MKSANRKYALMAAALIASPGIVHAAMAEEAKPVPMDTDGDGTVDAWDTNADGKPDAWDTTGDGKPDLFDTDGDGKPDGDGRADNGTPE